MIAGDWESTTTSKILAFFVIGRLRIRLISTGIDYNSGKSSGLPR